MARLFYQYWALYNIEFFLVALKIYLIVIQICQSRLEILQNIKYTLKNLLNKRIFDKSGHTGQEEAENIASNHCIGCESKVGSTTNEASNDRTTPVDSNPV